VDFHDGMSAFGHPSLARSRRYDRQAGRPPGGPQRHRWCVRPARFNAPAAELAFPDDPDPGANKRRPDKCLILLSLMPILMILTRDPRPEVDFLCVKGLTILMFSKILMILIRARGGIPVFSLSFSCLVFSPYPPHPHQDHQDWRKTTQQQALTKPPKRIPRIRIIRNGEKQCENNSLKQMVFV
jgi:hypothetical protein